MNLMRAVYAGLLIGFGIAGYLLSIGGHGRYMLPLAVLTGAAWIALDCE